MKQRTVDEAHVQAVAQVCVVCGRWRAPSPSLVSGRCGTLTRTAIVLMPPFCSEFLTSLKDKGRLTAQTGLNIIFLKIHLHFKLHSTVLRHHHGH